MNTFPSELVFRCGRRHHGKEVKNMKEEKKIKKIKKIKEVREVKKMKPTCETTGKREHDFLRETVNHALEHTQKQVFSAKPQLRRVSR